MGEYDDERLADCCTRIIGKLVTKCETTEVVGRKKLSCLQRKLEFEDRCAICQAAGLLSFLRDEAPVLEQAERLKADADRLRSFAMNVVGN